MRPSARYHRQVSKTAYPRDSFDDLPAGVGKVGAHRAENPRLRGGIVLLWAIVAVIVLTAAGIFGTLVLSGRIVLGAPVATPSGTSVPTPTITPVIDTSYAVLVLNATGEPGKATPVKDLIVKAGWPATSVNAGDAGSTYPITTVYYGNLEDAPAAAGLAKVIGGAVTEYSTKYQPAGDPESKQLTVVLGTGKTAAPTPKR